MSYARQMVSMRQLSISSSITSTIDFVLFGTLHFGVIVDNFCVSGDAIVVLKRVIIYRTCFQPVLCGLYII